MIIAAMHRRSHPSKVPRMYPLAAIAKQENVFFYYFTPKHVNFDNQTVEGFYYDNGWKKEVLPFPDIVINSARLKSESNIEICKKLSKHVLFSEEKIGSKKAVDRVLKKSKYRKHLPETIKLNSEADLIDFINKHHKVVLKPSKGAKGKSVYFITKEDQTIKIYHESNTYTNLEQVLENITITNFIAQRYINSKTKDNLPVDIRIHTQKNGNGQYVIAKIYPRIAPKEYTVTNISQGSYSVYIKPFLVHNYQEPTLLLYRLKKLGIEVSEYLDEHYQDLNELGIDVCIENNQLYIIEVNYRPGSTIQFFSSYQNLINLIKYCKYKVRKSRLT